MKLFLLIILAVGFVAHALPQSGRRAKVPPVPPPAEQPVASPSPTPQSPPQITAEKNEEYRCTEDGSLLRLTESELETLPAFTAKQVEVKANITSRPKPSYTREARRAGVQGYVLLRAAFLASGEIGPIKVVRGLPAGLTANAIRAACKIQFKPAMKEGKAVTQVVQIEYTFRLADSSIFSQ